MKPLVISDTSCLIALDKIDRLEILQKVFHTILITIEVQAEFGKKCPNWIQVRQVQNKEKQNELETRLDIGEASAIALALETPDCTLIMDEKKGRKIAKSLNLKTIGTLRIIQIAHQEGIIKSTSPLIKELQNNGFRFTPKILKALNNKK